jgi:predicted alpha/beta hydrolase family esterase
MIFNLSCREYQMFSRLEKRLLYYPEPSEAGNWEYGWKRLVGSSPPQRHFLVFHGNAGNAKNRLSITGVFGDGAYYYHEYVGFGSLSHLAPNKKDIMKQAITAVGSLDLTIPLYVVGESLGTGVACELVATCQLPLLRGLILITPYTTMTAMAHHLLPVVGALLLKDRYNCVQYLQDVVKTRSQCKVIVVGALDDEIIPLNHASKVAVAGNGVLLYYRGGHNDCYLVAREWVPAVKLQLGLV